MLPIFTIDLTTHQHIKEELLSLIDKEDSVKVDNSWGDNIDQISNTDWYSGNGKTKDYWKILYPHIKETIEPILYDKFFFKGWKITNYWFQQYKNGDEHTWHFHGASMYNFVYYVEKPNGVPTTEMIIPMTGQIIQPKVEEGQILVFPSIMRHRSPPNPSDERKTIIAFNVDIK
jgi:hypothetical protein